MREERKEMHQRAEEEESKKKKNSEKHPVIQTPQHRLSLLTMLMKMIETLLCLLLSVHI